MLMDDRMVRQYGPEPSLLSFAPHQEFDAEPYDDAAMSKPMESTPWEKGELGLLLPPYQSRHIQQTFSANVGIDTLFNNDSIPLDIPPFSTSRRDSETATIASPGHPSKQLMSTRNPLVQDLRMIQVSRSSSETDSPSFATKDSLNHCSTLPTRHRHPNTEDWELYRPIFTQLYRDENRTLKDVKSVMKNIYGFNATDKMYKSRINDWQLFKNQKAAEKEQIVQHQEAQRKLGIDLGQPMIRGQKVKEHKINRHLRGKRKLDCLSFQPAALDLPIPVGEPLSSLEDLRCRKRRRTQPTTPCNAISFSRVKDPAEYRNTENLLIQMDHYFCSKLENNSRPAWDVWLRSSTPAGRLVRIQYTYQHRTYACTFEGPLDLYRRYVTAAACLRNGRTRRGWKLIHEGAEMIRPCLLQENPRFLRDLLNLLINPALNAYTELLNLLLDLCAGMASVLYGKFHPISKVCHALRASRDRTDIVYLAQRKLLDSLNHHLGNDHEAPLYLRSGSFRSFRAQKTYDEAKRACRAFVTSCELFRGPGDYLTRRSLYELAHLCYCDGNQSEAAKILDDVLERGKFYGEMDDINIRAHKMLGLISVLQKDYGTAEHFLWKGLSSNLFANGPLHSQTIEIHNRYQLVAEKQQASKEMFTGRAQSPKISWDTFEEPLRYTATVRV